MAGAYTYLVVFFVRVHGGLLEDKKIQQQLVVAEERLVSVNYGSYLVLVMLVKNGNVGEK
jgi:hypothetical protein